MRSLCFGLCYIAERVGWAATCALILAGIGFCCLIDAVYGWPYGALTGVVALSIVASYSEPEQQTADDDGGLEVDAYYDALARDREGVAAIRHKLAGLTQ